MHTVQQLLTVLRREAFRKCFFRGVAALMVSALVSTSSGAQELGSGELRLPNPDGRDRVFDESRRNTMIELEFLDAQMSETHTLADFPAELRVINFWASWCVPCLLELPSLAAIHSEYPESSLRVIAISLDREDVSEISQFISQLDIRDMPWFVDTSRASGEAADVIALPTTIVVDDQGKEMGRLVGPADWSSPEARGLIDSLIGQD